jgi:hypothetical protein
MSLHHILLRLNICCLIWLGIDTGLALAQRLQPTPMVPPGPLRMHGQDQPTPVPFVAARPLSTAVAKSTSGTLTIGDLADYVAAGFVVPLLNVAQADVARLPKNMVRSGAEFIVSHQRAETELLASGKPDLIQQCSQEYNHQLLNDTGKRLFKENVTDKLSTPTQEAIAAYYKQHLAEFTHPEYFKMRHLILYTYQKYIVKAGDTLESIARQVKGDEKTANLIRSDVEQHPLRREPGKDFKPLFEGENLLVPMNEEDAKQVRLRLEGLLKLQEKGVKFEDLATTYSDAETKGNIIGPLPTGTRPILSELIKYGLTVPVGELSPIFRTKHGWNVIQVVERKSTETTPLSEEGPRIARELNDKLRTELTQKLLAQLMSQPGIVIHEEPFKKARDGQQVSTDTVVYTAGSQKLFWPDVQRSWERNNMPTEPQTLREVLQREGNVVRANILYYAERDTKENKSDADRKLRLRTLIRGDAYIGSLLRELSEKEISEEKINQYYNENKELFKLPPLIAYDSMALVPKPEERKVPQEERDKSMKRLQGELAEKLKKIKSAEEFTRTALQVNAPLRNTPDDPPKAATPVSTDAIPPEFNEQLSKLKPGQRSPPFVWGDRAVSVALLESQAERYRPVADAHEEIRMRLLQQVVNNPEKRRKIEQQMLERAKFEFLLP